MQVQWHVAFCNVTITEYAAMSYRDYYGSPANMLEAQLAAQAMAERKFGLGEFIRPYVDTLSSSLSASMGMPIIWPDGDELPYVDSTAALVREPGDVRSLCLGDPALPTLPLRHEDAEPGHGGDGRTHEDIGRTGLTAFRWRVWQYYRARGLSVRFGGGGGNILTAAHEISGGDILWWLAEDPDGANRVLEAVTTADLAFRAFDESLCGPTDGAYTGDDYSGLLSPEMYRRFAVPQYQRLYEGRSQRFMHSELLRAEHLRIAKDLLGITCFHGAGCRHLTLGELHAIMGHQFWTQITPQELMELTPQAITEKVARYAGSGCGYVQFYPGRGTPEANMEAAISAAERHCRGGRVQSGQVSKADTAQIASPE